MVDMVFFFTNHCHLDICSGRYRWRRYCVHTLYDSVFDLYVCVLLKNLLKSLQMAVAHLYLRRM